MKFGPVPLAQAQGTILAHSIALPTGRLRKGKILDAQDIAALFALGQHSVTVAQLAPGDLDEDAAATALATALLPASSLTLSTATAGRVNLIAKYPGVMTFDATSILGINQTDPGITLATVPQWHRVAKGDLVATIKIIPYAVPAGALARATKFGPNAVRLHTPIHKTATLIETNLPQVTHSAKGRRVLSERLARLGVTLTPPLRIPHTARGIATAIAQSPGDVVCILTASATSDAGDAGPAGLVQAGGTLDRFGIPVDPGNLLFLGRFGQKPVIGLPGCARSPALNGADWVLERVLCGLTPTATDIAAMGLGGLLKEIPSRPTPRRTTGPL